MFGLSMSELIVIGVVALIVIGPERLPKVARTVGHLVGRAQRYVTDIKSDIQREMDIQELTKLKQEIQSGADEMKSSFEKSVASIKDPFEEIKQELGDTSKQLKQELSELPDLSDLKTTVTDSAVSPSVEQAQAQEQAVAQLENSSVSSTNPATHVENPAANSTANLTSSVPSQATVRVTDAPLVEPKPTTIVEPGEQQELAIESSSAGDEQVASNLNDKRGV